MITQSNYFDCIEIIVVIQDANKDDISSQDGEGWGNHDMAECSINLRMGF